MNMQTIEILDVFEIVNTKKCRRTFLTDPPQMLILYICNEPEYMYRV